MKVDLNQLETKLEKMHSAKGTIAFPIVPLNEDKTINFDIFAQYLNWLNDKGIRNVCVPGMSAGYTTFDESEVYQLTKTARKTFDGIVLYPLHEWNDNIRTSVIKSQADCILVMPLVTPKANAKANALDFALDLQTMPIPISAPISVSLSTPLSAPLSTPLSASLSAPVCASISSAHVPVIAYLRSATSLEKAVGLCKDGIIKGLKIGASIEPQHYQAIAKQVPHAWLTVAVGESRNHLYLHAERWASGNAALFPEIVLKHSYALLEGNADLAQKTAHGILELDSLRMQDEIANVAALYLASNLASKYYPQDNSTEFLHNMGMPRINITAEKIESMMPAIISTFDKLQQSEG